MARILKNLKPYWKSAVLILILLVGQAFCELSLPEYTSDIIDVGIQNKGIEHIVPEKIATDEYTAAQIFMTDEQKDTWEGLFEKTDETTDDGQVIYERIENDSDKLDEYDTDLIKPIVLTYQLGHMEEQSFKDTVKENLENNPVMSSYASMIDDLSIEEIGQMFNMDIPTFEAEDEDGVVSTYVDMRPMMQSMIASGMMDSSQIQSAQDKLDETIDTVGAETLKSMGISYVSSCDEGAGMDVNNIQKSYLFSEGFRMAAMAFGMVVLAICAGFVASRAAAGVGRDLREKVFVKVMSFSNAEMDKFSTASLITRCTNDVQQVQLVTVLLLRMVIYAPILAIGGILKIANTGGSMTWVLVLGVAVVIGVVLLLMAIAMPKFKIMQKLVDAVNRVSREILTGLSVIRAFGREKVEEKRFDKANEELKRTQLFTNRVMTIMMPAMMFIMEGLVVLITWVASQHIDNGDLQVGSMTAFITYSMIIIMSFLLICAVSVFLPRAAVSAERIDEVLNTESSILEKENALDMPEEKSDLVFSHVNFRYPGAEEDALHDIDFTAKVGETTAIIGSTGSGKSTLVNLIPRFYDVTGGAVSIGGKDVRDVKIKDLRDKIGFVPQKGVLFSGTIASNIRFGAPNASLEEVKEAAAIAQSTDFIEEKEDGYDSFIAQGGSNVSGGQKQRLSIARAIAKKPDILVFDDSFSALDMKTDAELRKALAEKSKDCVKVIVAQRISTILHAEQIIVLEDGKIVGKGTHEELLKNCDTYLQIASSQLSQKELGGEIDG